MFNIRVVLMCVCVCVFVYKQKKKIHLFNVVVINAHCLLLVRARYIASPDWTIRSPFSTRTVAAPLRGTTHYVHCTVIETGFVSDKFLAFISLVYLLPSL